MATNQALIHYALDLETPPLIACDAPDSPAYSVDAAKVTCPDCMTHEQFPRLQAHQPSVRPYNVLMTAADLLSDGGENPEYDRAIAELTSSLLGIEDTVTIARILRALKKQGE